MAALQPSTHKVSANVLEDAELQWLVEFASEVCAMPISFVSELSLDLQRFRAEVGVGVREMPIEMSFCVHAIQQDDLLEVPDTTEDDRFRDHPLVKGPERLRFYAGMPIASASGHKIGSFCVMDRQPRALSEVQRRTLALLARFVEMRLQLAHAAERLAAEREDRRNALEGSRELMGALTDGLPVGVAHVDRGHHVRFCNDAFTRLAGDALDDDLRRLVDLALEGEEAVETVRRGERSLRVRCVPEGDPSVSQRGAILQVSEA